MRMLYSGGWLWLEEMGGPSLRGGTWRWALQGILLTSSASRYKLGHKTVKYLWSYPKGNPVRCEYKEKVFDMVGILVWGAFLKIH